MISVSYFRNGVTFEMDGKVMQIVEFQHVKPGKGAACVRVKMKNVITGAVVETTFNPNDKYPTAYIESKKMEYSYSDGDLSYFMDKMCIRDRLWKACASAAARRSSARKRASGC